jgi:hypothetical protein
MIFVSIRTEFTSDRKNGDLVAKIENNNQDAIVFRKDTHYRFTNDPSAQPVRIKSYTEEEKNEFFPIKG